MIYLDSSVVLAALFSEGRSPSERIWREPLTSSRLLEYETVNRLHALAFGAADIALAQVLIAGIALMELGPAVLARALEPFPVAVRTLDGLHLATMDFLRLEGHSIALASYDRRLNEAAEAMRFQLTELE